MGGVFDRLFKDCDSRMIFCDIFYYHGYLLD